MCFESIEIVVTRSEQHFLISIYFKYSFKKNHSADLYAKYSVCLSCKIKKIIVKKLSKAES